MKRIFLIGFRATGKTSVGKKLAKELNIPFYDLDGVIVEREGKEIKEIVENYGWEYFRNLERNCLLNFMELNDPFVLSCGGGAVLHFDLWENLKNARVIWLKASLERIADRIINDPQTNLQRPRLIEEISLMEEINKKLTERIPLYEKFSDFTIETSDISVDEVVNTIKKGLKSYGR